MPTTAAGGRGRGGGHVKRQVALDEQPILRLQVFREADSVLVRHRIRRAAQTDDAVLGIGRHHDDGEIGGRLARQQPQAGKGLRLQAAAHQSGVGVAAEHRLEKDLSSRAGGDHRLVQPLTPRRPRQVIGDDRLAGQGQARHGQCKIHHGISEDEDAAHAPDVERRARSASAMK